MDSQEQKKHSETLNSRKIQYAGLFLKQNYFFSCSIEFRNATEHYLHMLCNDMFPIPNFVFVIPSPSDPDLIFLVQK